ncbi:MAG: energy-coupling factor transporter transmembrane protein EcfT [Caloramator sp.]|nr:energy-coupling factor transporter transmembrane protein EcfT [Caloramator sp.]
MLTYKNRNTFLQRLHPVSGLTIILLYLLIFISVNNPIYLLLAALSVVFLAYIDGCMQEILKYGKLIFPFALLIIILNPLMVHNGNTVLYEGHINFPVIGAIRITMEAVMFGILSGIRVIFVTIIFGFGNLIIHPDRMFAFFLKYVKKSALLMSMTLRLFPAIMQSYKNIVDAERLRGSKLFDKKFINKAKSYGNVVNILFLSSLEDSAEMAESMYSRGYGMKLKRTSYFYEKLSFWDVVILIYAICIYIYIIYFLKQGLNRFEFYPTVDNPLRNISYHGILICLLLYIPSLLNWGWKVWK